MAKKGDNAELADKMRPEDGWNIVLLIDDSLLEDADASAANFEGINIPVRHLKFLSMTVGRSLAKDGTPLTKDNLFNALTVLISLYEHKLVKVVEFDGLSQLMEVQDPDGRIAAAWQAGREVTGGKTTQPEVTNKYQGDTELTRE